MVIATAGRVSVVVWLSCTGAARSSQRNLVCGWPGDRWIGAGIQRGGWQRSWGTFFAQQRLADQFQRLEAHGVHFSQSERLLERLPVA